MKKLRNWLGKITAAIDTPTIGPRRPVEDYLECGLLEAKSQNNYNKLFRRKADGPLNCKELAISDSYYDYAFNETR